MSALTKIYCPKCQQPIEIGSELISEQILCQSCGHEFVPGAGAGNSLSPYGFIQGSSKPAARATPKKNSGGIFALVILLIVIAGFACGYIPLSIALSAGLIGLLGGILIQLSRIAAK